MTHAHFQPVGGAAGDMILASLVGAGAPLEEISSTLGRLGVTFELHTERVEVNGVGALGVTVEHPSEHAHRTFRTIRGMIEGAGLPGRASQRAVEAFRLLAVAEGKIHDEDPEEVTFHEVGAVDSIVDMVGSCVALELLNVDSISCEPLPMGSGVVKAAHGPLPIPGPATLEILKGSRVRWPRESGEMTTPTAAALMVSFTGITFSYDAPGMVVGSVGYGAGTARFEETPNFLRVVVGEADTPSASGAQDRPPRCLVAG
ncbi:MAG: LarC family nickel insertion protein [Rubrobacteraceae bacterium]|nr:LarC family nickel insertion protein [Rubrobacteraceae bacterium]MDQ3437945.1 LarC family nickel insertion protein [Actinomycetota bacterium]